MELLKVNDLFKSFNNKNALSNINFDISSNEIFGIVGPDGSGKTTLLRILAGTLKQSQGDLTLNNSISNIGYMPQKFALYPDLTVEENIDFYSELFCINTTEKENKINFLLESFNMLQFKNRKAGKLSGGMKQKLALACTLIHKPDILVLDEPTNGVDPVSRREFWNILYELKSSNVCIITSTSYLEEAERCNRIMLLDQGEIITIGSPDSIKTNIKKELLVIYTEDARSNHNVLKKDKKEFSSNLTGNSIKILVESFTETKIEIEKYFKEKDIKDFTIKKEIPSIEDIFQYYIKKRNS